MDWGSECVSRSLKRSFAPKNLKLESFWAFLAALSTSWISQPLSPRSRSLSVLATLALKLMVLSAWLCRSVDINLQCQLVSLHEMEVGNLSLTRLIRFRAIYPTSTWALQIDSCNIEPGSPILWISTALYCYLLYISMLSCLHCAGGIRSALRPGPK